MLSRIALLFTVAAYTAPLAFGGSSGGYTYCYNYTECESDSISTKYAACYGYESCEDAEISSTHTLAYGELGCYSADIDSEYSYAYGHYSTYGADVLTYHLYSYGYKSSCISDIEPYNNEINIYYYGYYAGYGSDVSCYSGDTCHIYCGSSYGCYDVNFYCYSGATCYYDCSGDNVCPTAYAGVESDLTYVTSAGTGSSESGSTIGINKLNINNDIVVIFNGLTDEEITRFKNRNLASKDYSKKKLKQDTLDDTNSQLKMTYEQQFWLTGEALRRAEEEREEANRREEEQNEESDNKKENELQEEQYADIKTFKNYKKHHNNNNISGSGLSLFGLSLQEYGIGFIIDICFIAIIMQGYNYYTKAKAYQQI